MRIVFSTEMPDECGGTYQGDGKIIRLNVKTAKRVYPRQWKRKLMVWFAHEFTHYLQSEWSNTYELYLQELKCYKVQIFFEKLLRISLSHESPENGAISSITHIISQFKAHDLMEKAAMYGPPRD